MFSARLAALFVVTSLMGSSSPPLRVLRVTPTTPAEPNATVAVTFDRPVAGGLETAVEAASVFRIDPALPGTAEWRDPVTLRFTPSRPFEPGREYTVTIAAGVRAMDGSVLERPHAFRFRVSPPRLLAATPVGPNEQALHVEARPTFRLLYSAAPDPALLSRQVSIALSAACGGSTIPLRITSVRRIADDDPPSFLYTGINRAWSPRPDTTGDLRRVVELMPESPLPRDCGGVLRVPDLAGEGATMQEWGFRTYGPLRLTEVACARGEFCPTGPVRLVFSTPVRGAELARRLRIDPGATPFTIVDTAQVSAVWNLPADLKPRAYYAVVIDSALTDVFGQRFTGTAVRAFRTSGYAPTVAYDYGRALIERDGFRTLAVQHVNTDTLVVTAIAVPDSMEAAFLAQSWNWDEPWSALAPTARTWRVSVRGGEDERRVTGIRLPLRGEDVRGGGQQRAGTLLAVRVSSPDLDSISRRNRPIALVQITDLAVHARAGTDAAMVWVTGVHDGLPRAGADVTLYDAKRRVRATGRTDAQGIARLAPFRQYTPEDECDGWCGGFEGVVTATLGDDRAVVGLSSYDPDLAPWRFGISSAWGQEREPQAAALFTERGIYRPGESVHAKAIVRDGALGTLVAPRGDSIRWLFRDREGGTLEEATVATSAFGTADRTLRLSPDVPLGDYAIEVQRRLQGQWRTVAWTNYQVAEYRPPEFLVDVTGDAAPRLAGDSATAVVSARYLFGAPMAQAPVRWMLRRRTLSPWELQIPGADAYQIGAMGDWWEEPSYDGLQVVSEGVDTLDATGQAELRAALPEPTSGRPAAVSIVATVTDANRQTVSGGASWTVHPAAFYIGARTRGERWFWTAGSPVEVEVVTVRPDGTRLGDVDVRGSVVRREWHSVRRVRGGQIDEVGGWVADTVATCDVRTAADDVALCRFTPANGGQYTVRFTARDAAGRTALTSFGRWASGADWVPWNDETRLKMDVVADRDRYSVGDTATVLFASPFTDAEAWITVERERVIESRRVRITSGATTLRLPITEAHAPNVFVSIVVVRGRSAEPGPLDDPGRPTLRVGYAELRVTPEVKRLAVSVTPLARDGGTSVGNPAADIAPVEYQPGDTARVALDVRDANGSPQRAEVTLWAVDEGVLALTGYRTPDPIDLIYQVRGLGVRLASNLVSVSPQIPDGEKGRREAGGGGGGDLAGILRSRFQTTAFFLGSVVTDANGRAVATAKLPDNLTTFRVMAVAVTEADRFGAGEAKLLVTRPLVARPALPRFVRPGDRFVAGVVVNHRMGGTPEVDVEAMAAGAAKLEGRKKRSERLAAGRGSEVRFDFSVPSDRRARNGLPYDSASFTFAARAEREADAVAVSVPVRPDYHPLAATIAGVLRDTATAEFALQPEVDAARSRIEIGFGTSPLTIVQGAGRDLQVYPYYCTEQVASTALPLIALYRARLATGDEVGLAALGTEIQEAVRMLSRRRTAEGAIGYWSALDWSTPWLSSYAGRVLLEARDAGFSVDSTVLAGLADYVQRALHETDPPRAAVAWAYTDQAFRLSERVAAADFLSRVGRADAAVENTLLQQASRLTWEDRVALAEMLHRRGAAQPARQLLDAAWSGVRIEGRRAVLPADAHRAHYFASRVRPAARLLEATLAIDPAHAGIAPLVETLVQQGRADGARAWNTQDYGWAVLALSAFEETRRDVGQVPIRVRSGNRTILSTTAGAVRDTSLALDRLVLRKGEDTTFASLTLDSEGGEPVWFHITVREVPKEPPVRPIDRGIQVERWYERPGTREPILSVAEGEVVRVRLRITVPAERHFLVLDDPLPAGLEAVDLSLRTVSPFGAYVEQQLEPRDEAEPIAWEDGWYYGAWDAGLWSPFDHKELRDDRVVYSATVLWPGTYSATYLARATTAGTFVLPPAHAEEMYNPGVNGRTGGGTFTVTRASR